MICKKCGAALREDARFCNNCGTKTGNDGLTEFTPTAAGSTDVENKSPEIKEKNIKKNRKQPRQKQPQQPIQRNPQGTYHISNPGPSGGMYSNSRQQSIKQQPPRKKRGSVVGTVIITILVIIIIAIAAGIVYIILNPDVLYSLQDSSKNQDVVTGYSFDNRTSESTAQSAVQDTSTLTSTPTSTQDTNTYPPPWEENTTLEEVMLSGIWHYAGIAVNENRMNNSPKVVRESDYEGKDWALQFYDGYVGFNFFSLSDGNIPEDWFEYEILGGPFMQTYIDNYGEGLRIYLGSDLRLYICYIQSQYNNQETTDFIIFESDGIYY